MNVISRLRSTPKMRRVSGRLCEAQYSFKNSRVSRGEVRKHLFGENVPEAIFRLQNM